MKLSFEDEESLNEAVGSLHWYFNNPPSDPDALGVESKSKYAAPGPGEE